jgi:hypothetical protein
MNTKLSNEPDDTGGDQSAKAQRLDLDSLRHWLSKEVIVALPRWALVSAGLFVLVLLLIALD